MKALDLHDSAFKDRECNCMGLAKTLRMNDDFVEKQIMSWWSLEDLQLVLQNGGYLHSEYFRAYFLPVLQRSLEELVPFVGN